MTKETFIEILEEVKKFYKVSDALESALAVTESSLNSLPSLILDKLEIATQRYWTDKVWDNVYDPDFTALDCWERIRRLPFHPYPGQYVKVKSNLAKYFSPELSGGYKSREVGNNEYIRYNDKYKDFEGLILKVENYDYKDCIYLVGTELPFTVDLLEEI